MAKKLSDTIHRTGGHWKGRYWISDNPKVTLMPQSNPNFEPNMASYFNFGLKKEASNVT